MALSIVWSAQDRNVVFVMSHLAAKAAPKGEIPVKIGSAFPSNYLKHEDLNGRHVAVTIERVVVETVGQGEDKETKPVLYFRNGSKGMTLNKTNAETITELLGTDETDEWIGKRVVLYHDKNVMFGGKKVGGIRIMAAPQGSGNGARPAPPPPPPPPLEEVVDGFQATDEDVPF